MPSPTFVFICMFVIEKNKLCDHFLSTGLQIEKLSSFSDLTLSMGLFIFHVDKILDIFDPPNVDTFVDFFHPPLPPCERERLNFLYTTGIFDLHAFCRSF
jgi:hypothetical protein